MKTFQLLIILILSSHFAYSQTANYEYDKLQLLIKITYINGISITYEYAANGNRMFFLISNKYH